MASASTDQRRISLWPRGMLHQMMLGVVLIIGLSITGFGAYMAREQSRLVEDSLRTQADAAASFVATGAAMPLLTEQYAELGELMHRFAAFPGLLSIDIVDRRGVAVARVVSGAEGFREVHFPGEKLAPPAEVLRDGATTARSVGPEWLDVWRAVGGVPPAGWVRVRFSLDLATDVRRHLIAGTLLAGLLAVMLAAGFSLFALRPATHRVRRLTEFANRLDADFGAQTRLEPLCTELDELAGALNRASERLATQHAEVVLSEHRMRALHDSALDCVVTIDSQGKIVEFNPSAERSFGYAREQVIGERIDTLLLPERYREPYRAGLQRSLAGATESVDGIRVELELLHQSGEEIPVEAGISLIEVDGEQLFTAYLRDIRDQRSAQIAMREAKEVAESANQAKSDFLANMSHEIRTPLNGMIGMTELALDSSPSSEIRDYLETAKRSAEALMAVVDDVLDFSKIEAGRMRLENVPFSLREEVESLLRPLAAQAHAKGLDLICDFDDDLPDRLVGDPVRIGQILINLVGNAIKFTGQGEVLVRARAAEVHDASVTLEFLVRDTGIGIPPDKQAVIFDAFAQADSSTTRKFGGTGLGLAICRRLSALMNGGLSVQSRPGFGTTFTVTLVCGCDGVELLGPPSVDLAERRLLYVDPNPDCQALVRSATEKSGAIAVFADDVAAARRILRQGRAQFDIVAFDARSLEAAETPEEPTSLRAESAGELVSEIGAAHVIVASAAHRLVRDRRLCEANDWPHAVVKPVTAAGWLRVLAAAALPTSFDDGLDEVRTPMASDSDPLMLLLVEDNPVNQQVATRMLERAGHTVVVAENGREGIDAVMSAREPFDAILMDVQMPVMGGIAATRAIREHEGELARHGLPHRHTPIIAMTARAMQGDRDLCLEAGMDDYVSKPIRPQSLFQALDRLTRDREPRPPVDVTSEQAALPDTLPRGIDTRFDREVALGVFGNDEDLLVHISELIRRNTPPMLARLGQAMADGDFEQVGFQAHTIKGSLSSVGAKRASALAGQIETQANAGDASRFPELFRKLEQAYEEVSAALA